MDIMDTNYINIKIDIGFKLMWTIPILKVWMEKHYLVSRGIWSTPKEDGRHLDTFHFEPSSCRIWNMYLMQDD